MGTHEIGGRRAGWVLFTLSDSAVGGGGMAVGGSLVSQGWRSAGRGAGHDAITQGELVGGWWFSRGRFEARYPGDHF